MAGFLDWLGADPSQPPTPAAASGGLLGAGSPTASTQTPTPGAPSATPYALQPMPMGPRWLQLLLGGLNGLSGSTGYTGLAALGHGAATSEQASMQRLQQNAQMAMMGQQYKAGQQTLAQGNLQLAQSVAQYNYWNHLYNKGAPDITVEQARNDPQLLANVMQATGPNGQASDPNAGQAPGQPAAAASPTTSQSSGASPNITPQAIFAQESGNNPNSPTSVDGAVGQAQIMPATFKMYARPGEDINNPKDNAAVGQRIITDITAKYPNDPARQAVAYFSGAGNVAPAGSPTPWIHNASDGNGTTVAQYVDQVAQRDNGGQSDQGSQAAQAQPQGQGQPAQVGGDAGGQMVQAFTEAYGMSPQQMEQFGRGMMRFNPQQGMAYIKMAQEADPRLIYGKKALETEAVQQNTPHELKAGGQLVNGQGQGIGRGVPTSVKIYDPKSGNYVAGLRYPSGELVIGNEANGQPAVEELGPGNKEMQEGFAKRRVEMSDAINAGVAGEQQALAMADALKATQSGTWATEFGHIKAGLQSAGLNDLADTLLPNTNAAAVQMAAKDALQGVFSQMKPLLGPRIAAQEVNLYFKASANPDLLPEANAKMISMVVGGMRYKRELYHALSQQPGNVDPGDFEIQFQKDHPIQGYINAAEKEIGPLKGMEPKQGGAASMWPKTGPATLGAGASAEAANTWFERLPVGSWFINPADGKKMQKVK